MNSVGADAPRPLTLVLAADSHELHREADMPSVAGESIFVHAGDATMFSRSMAAVADFNSWLADVPYTHKIFVPGNHESFLEEDPAKRVMLSNAAVLVNESAEILGLKIWGSPVTPLSGSAFGMTSAASRRRL